MRTDLPPLAGEEHVCDSCAFVFADLHRLAPQVTTLRLLDVLAWKVGRRAPQDDVAAMPD